MSIFSKIIDQLQFDDIDELKIGQAKENIRLEFKREMPSKEKDVLLKEISAFANTYGGYIVIGAGEDGKGNLATLDGVVPIDGFKQKVIQWCFDGLYPPLSPLISDPIKNPQKSNQVFYVIYIEESWQTPHFINGRQGCYIRTDEFNQRFEPRLAEYEEIQHLANRRAESVRLRESLLKRSEERFRSHSLKNRFYQKDDSEEKASTISIAILPFSPLQKPCQS